jgi:2-C-methyl-D-erythritol 4-phosphate cytidylyltransferase
MNTSLAAIVVAAGASRRMGIDKITVPLAGRPLLWHSLTAFQDCREVTAIYVVSAPDRQTELSTLAAEFPKVRAVVPGGDERIDSVLAGVQAVGGTAEFVAVHDGARPLITPAAIAACFAAAREVGAAVCAEPVTDTLHRMGPDGRAVETVSRDRLWRMQTPQIARTALLADLLAGARAEGAGVTDEISLLVRAGSPARIVENPDWNFKVTYPRDLVLAEAVLSARRG